MPYHKGLNVNIFTVFLGFAVILAQFPNTPQFRPPAWFCVAVGVSLLQLQFFLFHGESTWHCSKDYHKKIQSKMKRHVSKKHVTFCQVFVSTQ